MSDNARNPDGSSYAGVEGPPTDATPQGAAPEALPCPFCGADARIEDDGVMWNVQCGGEHGSYVQVYEATRAEAVAAWNRRAPTAGTPPDMLAALARVGIEPGEDNDGQWTVAAEPAPVVCADLTEALRTFADLRDDAPPAGVTEAMPDATGPLDRLDDRVKPHGVKPSPLTVEEHGDLEFLASMGDTSVRRALIRLDYLEANRAALTPPERETVTDADIDRLRRAILDDSGGQYMPDRTVAEPMIRAILDAHFPREAPRD